MPTAAITGCALQYSDTGGTAGEVLVFLHAFPLSHEMWAPQIAALGKQHRCIAMSARGFGGTTPVPQTLAMSLIADDVAALLQFLKVDRAVIVGLSMGGYAAFEVFRRHRKMVRGLVLADTRAGADSSDGKQNREAFARNAIEKGIGWVADDMAPKLQRPERDTAVDAEVRRLIRANPPEGVAAAQRGMAARVDSNDVLPTIAVPALVIVGKADKLTPPAEAQAMAKAIRGSSLVEIDGAGHLSNLEQPAMFNDVLAAFLRSLPA